MTKFSAQQQSQLAQIGVFLRESREKKGKSLEDIAIRTYIRPQLLGGIESGDPDLLPEPIFVQGFILRYAENLGLNGKDLAQQFSVDSIPSTPRPVKQSPPEDSPTTRLTRVSSSTETPSANASMSQAAAGIFSAGSAAPLEDALVTNRAELSTVSDEVPLIVDDAVLNISSDVSSDVPFESAPLSEADTFSSHLDESSISDSSLDDLIAKAQSDSDFQRDLDSFVASDADETVAGNALGLSLGADRAAPSDSEDAFARKIAEFDRQNLNAQGLEPQSLEPQSLESRNFDAQTPNTRSEPVAAVNNSSFDDGLPDVFTTAASTTPVAAAPPAPAYTNPEPVGVEYSGDLEGPNLKPFIIGGVAAAALVAGIVALASLFGGGDRTPAVADNPAVVEQTETDLKAVGTETLPPAEPVITAPPASTAPVYVEAKATAEAWVSVIADGTLLFEGTLQPGDNALWEGQQEVNVYSGDAGALEISQNGGKAAIMGERSQPEEKIFTLN